MHQTTKEFAITMAARLKELEKYNDGNSSLPANALFESLQFFLVDIFRVLEDIEKTSLNNVDKQQRLKDLQIRLSINIFL